MTASRRRWLVIGLAVIAVGGGCNPLLLTSYFFTPEPREEAKLQKLAGSDKKKEVKVVILPYMVGLETRQEFIGADYDLSEKVSHKLKDLFKFNDENVTIVSPRKVEDFKSSHPSWQKMPDLHEIGRHFGADYVIYLEIHQLSMHDKGGSQLYRGRIKLRVSLLDVKNPDEGPIGKDYVFTYPSEAKSIEVDMDTPPEVFRENFLSYVAKQISWLFSAHGTSHTYYDVDD
jgi:hypothetical protein